jgi:hypothetical protein
MDWSALAAWAEVGGAVGVIISLLYLSAQIRQSNRVARAAAQEVLATSGREFTQPIASDPELYRIFSAGVEEFDSLVGADRGRFLHLAFQMGKVFESAYYHHLQGLLDDGIWAGWKAAMAHYFHAPGWKRYWALRADLYSPAFRDFVRSLPSPTQRASASVLAAVDGGQLPGESSEAGSDRAAS